MNEKNQSFKDAIKSYLDRRAGQDELFAKTYAKEGKTLEECCNYIIGEARKRGNAVAMTAEEVYGLAVHYYDEDNIKINPVYGYVQASASDDDGEAKHVKLTAEEEKQAREEAIHRLAEEQYQKMKKRPQRARKEENESVQQMSLF